jgi:hypothetical protein
MVAIRQLTSKPSINRKVLIPCTLGEITTTGIRKSPVATAINNQTGAVNRKKNRPNRAAQLL